MISATSYIKCGEEFVAVSEFSGRIPDTNYIDGAIVLVASGRSILDVETWDHVDQLWAYLVDALEAISHQSGFSTCLPDQPIRLIFTPLSNDQVKISREGYKSTSVVVMEIDLIQQLKAAAVEFFEQMQRLAPENGDAYADVLERLAKI